MGGQKFGGGAGGPAPWGAPSPWQQQPQRQQAGGNWGNPWGQQGKSLFILYCLTLRLIGMRQGGFTPHMIFGLDFVS